jgi:hypothetical protein
MMLWWANVLFIALSFVKPSVIFFPFSIFLPSIMLSPDKILFDKCFIEIMQKIFLEKLDSELMRKSCARTYLGSYAKKSFW